MILEPWVSVEGTADYSGVSKETIYRWLERKKIPAYRIGKLWKFKPSEVDQWVISGGAVTEMDNSPKVGLNHG